LRIRNSIILRRKNYAVVFEDLRELDKGTKYYAVCLTFIDTEDETRRLQTYANSYDFKIDDDELVNYFGIITNNRHAGSPVWGLYTAFNMATPSQYHELAEEYHNLIVNHIDNREHNEGFCCYMARHNRTDQYGNQIFRSGKNTAKTRLLRPTLYDAIGGDTTISFCYRRENELTDTEIILALNREH
jgi:hypothetical protein